MKQLFTNIFKRVLASSSFLGLDAATHECYKCGYMRKAEGEMEILPGDPFCNDFADGVANLVTCPDGDCCAEMREYFTKNDTDNLNATYVQEVGRHGCESSLDHYEAPYHIECPEAATSTPNCQAFTAGKKGDIVEHAEVCLCNEDRCNNGIPLLEPTTAKPNGAANIVQSPLMAVLLLTPFLYDNRRFFV